MLQWLHEDILSHGLGMPRSRCVLESGKHKQFLSKNIHCFLTALLLLFD